MWVAKILKKEGNKIFKNNLSLANFLEDKKSSWIFCTTHGNNTFPLVLFSTHCPVSPRYPDPARGKAITSYHCTVLFCPSKLYPCVSLVLLCSKYIYFHTINAIQDRIQKIPLSRWFDRFSDPEKIIGGQCHCLGQTGADPWDIHLSGQLAVSTDTDNKLWALIGHSDPTQVFHWLILCAKDNVREEVMLPSCLSVSPWLLHM